MNQNTLRNQNRMNHIFLTHRFQNNLLDKNRNKYSVTKIGFLNKKYTQQKNPNRNDIFQCHKECKIQILRKLNSNLTDISKHTSLQLANPQNLQDIPTNKNLLNKKIRLHMKNIGFGCKIYTLRYKVNICIKNNQKLINY